MTVLGAVLIALVVVVFSGVAVYFLIRPKSLSDLNIFVLGFLISNFFLGLVRLALGQSLEEVGAITLFSLLMGVFIYLIVVGIAKIKKEM